jgi:hypothetical protein
MEQVTNKPRRMRRSQQQILNLLSEFEKSQVSVKDFCLMYNIGKATFHKWQSRYKSKPDQPKPAGFADVQIIAPSLKGLLFAEVSGIKIYQPVAATYLKELLP